MYGNNRFYFNLIVMCSYFHKIVGSDFVGYLFVIKMGLGATYSFCYITLLLIGTCQFKVIPPFTETEVIQGMIRQFDS